MFKKYLNAVLYYFYPQSGEIACLKTMVKNRDDLILTIKANRQTIMNENAKLEAALLCMEADRNEARYLLATLEVQVATLAAQAAELEAERLDLAGALVMKDVKVFSEYYFNHVSFDCSPQSTNLKRVGQVGTLIFIPDRKLR
jgi:hypothetical protein